MSRPAEIVVFACNWDGLSCVEAAARAGLRYPASVRLVRAGCLSRIHSGLMLRAFELGAEGVMLLGCEPGKCHFDTDAGYIAQEFGKARGVLRLLGLGENRLLLTQMPPGNGRGLVEKLDSFVAEIGEMPAVDPAVAPATEADKPRIEREIMDTGIRLCLDCGKCTVVCPVAQYDPQFNPRLAVQRELGQNSQGTEDKTIWSCVNCHVCVERCNYHVKFPEFVRALRHRALTRGAQLQCSHGGSLQAMMHMMALPDLRQERLNWLPPDVELSEGSDTLFFVGCAPYFDVLFSHLEMNTVDGAKASLRLLQHARIPFNVLASERCCGRDLLLAGDRQGFVALAKANKEEFARRGIKKIIASCSECFHTLKVDYPAALGDTGIEVLHLTEVIAPLVEKGKLRPGKLVKKATYHDPCTLGRCARIFDQPRRILDAVQGLERLEMEQNREMALCCGASPWAHCGAVNRQIQGQRLAQAEATGADALVVACPKCHIHLRCAQKGKGPVSRIEILDLASLVARTLNLGGEPVG
ncbi:MAG: hydrogenase iron-sulfur subunit [Chloroflexota bacterium]